MLKIPKSALSISGAENLKSFSTGDTSAERKFCSICGSCIFKAAPQAEIVDLSLGLFEKILPPKSELFCSQKQPWEADVKWPVEERFEEKSDSTEMKDV